MDNNAGWTVFFFGMIVFVLGGLMGATTMRIHVRHEAIEKGHAEYNQETGNWQWKEIK